MAIRIACDLDGTLADMEAGLQREAERLFGYIDVRGTRAISPVVEDLLAGDTVVQPEDGPAGEMQPASANGTADARPGLSHWQMRKLWVHVRQVEDFWLALPEIEPGAVARLAEAATRHGWEVIFVTQRPSTAGETSQLQSQRWLEAHGFELPSVYVMKGSRGKLAEALALDVVIDDRPENCLDVVTDSKARALLVWRDAPHAVPPAAARLGIETIFSMGEALRILQSMSDRARKPSGLVDRVRAAIDL
jgi:hypothetical protein